MPLRNIDSTLVIFELKIDEIVQLGGNEDQPWIVEVVERQVARGTKRKTILLISKMIKCQETGSNIVAELSTISHKINH